jgi:DNA-binding transcriptional ArsR family regulator
MKDEVKLMNQRELVNRKPSVVQIEVGLAYEFLLSLIVFSEKKGDEYEYELGNEWFEIVRTKARPDLVKAIKLFQCDCNHIWKHLLGIAYESEAPHDVAAFLTNLAEIDALELRLHLLGYYRRGFRRSTPLDVILQAAEGDKEAQRQYLEMASREEGDWREALRTIFSIPAEAMKESILHVLQGWYERVFRFYEQQWLPILERDAEAKRAIATMPLERFIETATNGLLYEQEAGLRRVLLIPSYVLRPWNELTEYQDIKIFCYPVADESVNEDGNIPPARLVRLYKALADERRLRILKMLMTRSYTLQEIADEFGVAKTTMHHHLGTLRTAGLVRAQADGKFYNLRQDMLAEVSELLDSYLKGKS